MSKQTKHCFKIKFKKFSGNDGLEVKKNTVCSCIGLRLKIPATT